MPEETTAPVNSGYSEADAITALLNKDSDGSNSGTPATAGDSSIINESHETVTNGNHSELDGSSGEQDSDVTGKTAGEGDDTSGHSAPDNSDAHDFTSLPENAVITLPGGESVPLAEIKAIRQRSAQMEKDRTAFEGQKADAARLAGLFRNGLASQRDQAKATFDELAAQAQHYAAQGEGPQYDAYRAKLQDAYQKHQDAEALFAQVDKATTEQSQQEHAAALSRMSRELTNPETGIIGYDQARHSENASYLEGLGFGADEIGGLTDSRAWRMIDKARRFDTAQKLVADAKAKPAQSSAAPTIKSRGDNTTSQPNPKKTAQKQARERLKSSGSLDDAIKALGG